MSPKINQQMTAVEWTLLIALSLLWGGAFFFTGVAVREIPPLTVALCRAGFAAGVLILILILAGQRFPSTPHLWGAFLGMGLLNNAIPFALLMWGQTHIASGLASILNGTTPFFAVLVAHWFTEDERITTEKMAGVAIGFAGTVVLIGYSTLETLGLGGLAQLACIIAAVSYACAGVFGRRFRSMGVTPMQTATGQLLVSTILLLPLSMIVDRPWTLAAPSNVTIGALASLGVLSTALAYVVYFRILATAGATNLMLVTLLIPVSAIALGAAFLGEVLLVRHFVGLGLIALGLAAIDGRPVRWIHRRRRT